MITNDKRHKDLTQHYLEALDKFEKRLMSFQEDKNNDFNFFSAVGMSAQEIKHSAFLAWLLKSSEEHKLGNTMIQKLCDHLYAYKTKQDVEQSVFENSAIIHNQTQITTKQDFLNLIIGNVEVKTEVVTSEDKRIDILVDIPSTQTVIVIENKMFTKSHNNQLVNYQNYINNEVSGYKDYRHKIFIYLSPEGEYPINFGGDERYNNDWCVFDYKNIVTIISDILQELQSNNNYSQLKGKQRNKLTTILEDYIEMIKTNVLMENPNVMEKCKNILDDKQLRTAFELLTLYTQTATEDKVLSFVRANLDAVEDGAKTLRYFYTPAMEEYFQYYGEAINYHLCRCICQPIGAMGGIVGYDICIGLEKQSGKWTRAQENILSKLVPNDDWKNKTYVTFQNTRVVLLSDREREQMFEEIKPNLEKQLQKFKEILNRFENALQEISRQ